MLNEFLASLCETIVIDELSMRVLNITYIIVFLSFAVLCGARQIYIHSDDVYYFSNANKCCLTSLCLFFDAMCVYALH